MRINGLSGIDVDTMVKEMIKPYNIKVDRERQQRELIKWKQDLYQDTTKDIRELYNKYFDVLSKDFILSPNRLSCTSAESRDTSILDVNGLAGAAKGTYSVDITKLAETAHVTSNIDIRSQGLKTKLDLTNDVELTFNVNETPMKITVKKDSTVGDMIKTINDSLKDLGVKARYSEFSGKITIENTKTGDKSSLEINGLQNIKVGSNSLFDVPTSISNHGQIDLVKNFVIDLNTSLKSLSGTELKIPESLGKDDKEQTIKIEDNDTIQNFIDKIKSNLKDPSKIEFKDGKINYDGKEIFNTNTLINEKLSLSHLAGEKITIGSIDVSIDANDTIKSLSEKIKTLTNKNVIISGGVIKIDGEADDISFTRNDMITKNSYNKIQGSDAEYSITLPDGTQCQNLKSETNAFTKDNVTFNFNKKGQTTFTVKNDTKEAIDNITSFVNDYNKLVNDIYSKVTTRKNKMGEYLPLTADQKKEMSEDEIKKWEEKGKMGLLKGDMLLNSILSDMRGIFDSYSGMGKELNKIGISLSKDTLKPNLIEIDKEKLNKALENDGENVVNLLISTDKEPLRNYNGESVLDKDGNQVMMAKGAFAKLKNVAYDASIKYKSPLLEKAGFDGGFADNELSKLLVKRDQKIRDMEKDLARREQSFYLKFSRLEQAMNKFNAQQASLMQQFGGM